MTAAGRAGVRVTAGLALVAACAACGGAAAAPAASGVPAAASTAAPSLAPSSSAGLLDSRPATLDALRQEQARRPVSVRVPGQDGAPVEARTTDPVSGGLDLPKDAGTVVWWGSGAAPGDGAGSVVLAAHVSYQGQTGPFTHLSRVRPGAVVTVTSADGSTARYRVDSTRSAPKDALDRAALFRSDGPPALVLVTCGGAYDEVTHSYESNIVVTATPA